MAPGLHKRNSSVENIDVGDVPLSEDIKPLEPPPSLSDKKVIGINGYWYDVTNFLEKHPGGPVIKQFVGHDATHVFYGYGHTDAILKHRKPVGTYKMPMRHPADEDFEKLIKMFKEKGFFETDWGFYAKKMSVVAVLILTVFYLVVNFDQWYVHYFAAVVLAFFWQQCGFIMHEFMHTQVFRDPYKDSWFGMVFGTIGFGISTHWWQDEHIVHHALTNTVGVSERFADPQMWESVWAQNEKLYPLFWRKDNGLFTLAKACLQYALIKIQHFTFVPVVTMVGRFEIVTDSFLKERRWYEWMMWFPHWIWLGTLLSYLPDWRTRIIFYVIASWVQGIFHFQLILSHYCKDFLFTHEFHRSSWYKFQIDSNMNIDSPWWQDWYYGGLNYHIEHHLFPRMARKHLRTAGPYVEEVCKKHGIQYDSCSFTSALWRTLVHLKKAGMHYTLDPR